MSSSRVWPVLAAVLAVGSLAVMPGCDWLKGSGSDSRQSPYLTNLSVSRASVLCDQEFTITFRYDDPQGDIKEAQVTFEYSADGVVDVLQETPLWPENISRSSGAVTFPFSFPCETSAGKGGPWSIKVEATDDLGHTSNVLLGAITLTAAG